MAKEPEILPPGRELGPVLPVSTWQKIKPAFVVTSSSIVGGGLAAWAFSQFLQARGFTSVIGSRVFLGLACLGAGGVAFGWTRLLRRKNMWLFVTVAVIAITAILLDKLIPMPTVPVANQQEAKPQPVQPQARPQPYESQPYKVPTPPEISKQPPVPLRAYDLTGRRHDAFKALLNTQLEPRDTIRVGCIGWIEESCVAAGRFLLLFSEAGWKIDSDRVFRFDPSIPSEGMNIESKTPKYTDNLPPHLGHWNQMGTSQVTFWRTFSWMQIPVHASGNPDMPEGTIGIYFGPEPKNINVRTIKQAQKDLAQVLGFILIEARAIDNTCSAKPDTCKTQRLQWTQTVSAFLDYCDCGLSPSWIQKWNNNGKKDESTLKRQKLLEPLIVALNRTKQP